MAKTINNNSKSTTKPVASTAKAASATAKKDENKDKRMPLTRKNYIMMLIGLGLIVLGYILMSGGNNGDPEVFDYSIYSFRRITLAPILVLGGFGFEIFAIMKRFDK